MVKQAEKSVTAILDSGGEGLIFLFLFEGVSLILIEIQMYQ